MLKVPETEPSQVSSPPLLTSLPSNIIPSPRSSLGTLRPAGKPSFDFVQNKVLPNACDNDFCLDIEDNNEQEYFKPDSDHESQEEDEHSIRKKLQKEKDSNPFLTDFKVAVFLKFFVMHMLFFCCLGPFIILLAPIIGWKLLANQDFTPAISVGFIRQSLEFLIIVSFFIVYYLTDTPGLQVIEIYMMLVNVLIRMIMISCKYAYQSELYLKLMHTIVLTPQDKQNDLMLSRWRLQTDEIIMEEIKAAIMRLEIDSPLFFFNFLGKISPELTEQLSKKNNLFKKLTESVQKPKEKAKNHEPKKAEDNFEVDEKNPKTRWRKGLKKIVSMKKKGKSTEIASKDAKGKYEDSAGVPKRNSEHFAKSTAAIFESFLYFIKPQKLEAKYLFGYNLAFDLRKKGRDAKFNRVGKICLFLSMIRALLPTFYRTYLICYEKEDIPFFTEKPYIVAVAFILNSFLFWANTFTLAVAVQDFKTKVWCFKQIGFLISPRKIHEFKEKKLYPTLNFFDPVTIKTWSSLRKIMKDYGKKYILRNNFNITISMTIYIFVLSTFVLQLLGVFTAYNDPLLLIVFGYESILFFTIFMSILTGAAFLNDQYKVHKNLLKKNKTIISDFAKLSHLYVGRDAIKPDNIIYKQGLKLLKNELGEEDFENKLIARCEKLISMIDETIEELEFEEVNEPFTVMGIKVDYGLLKSMGIGVISLLFAIGQSLVNR